MDPAPGTRRHWSLRQWDLGWIFYILLQTSQSEARFSISLSRPSHQQWLLASFFIRTIPAWMPWKYVSKRLRKDVTTTVRKFRSTHPYAMLAQIAILHMVTTLLAHFGATRWQLTVWRPKAQGGSKFLSLLAVRTRGSPLELLRVQAVLSVSFPNQKFSKGQWIAKVAYLVRPPDQNLWYDDTRC